MLKERIAAPGGSKDVKVPVLEMELVGGRGVAYSYELGRNADRGEMLFEALENLGALIGECDELLELLSPDWSLPHLPGSIHLHRTLKSGEYGVELRRGYGILGRAEGSRRHEYNVARAAIEMGQHRLKTWRNELEQQYRQWQREEAA